MLNKVKAFLYAVTHATGRILGLKVHLGPFSLDLWVGRVLPTNVAFSVSLDFDYYSLTRPMLMAGVEVGIIEASLTLTRSRPESE